MLQKEQKRERRRAPIRARMQGVATKPRLVIKRGNNNIYAQLIDDEAGKTLCAANDLKSKTKGKIERAKEVGQAIAKLAQEKKVNTIVFDRAGYKYHGRVKALADAAREGGLQF